jgi:hypothetical protein
MDAVRRPSLLEAGEPLLLARSTIETAVRWRTFAEEFGVPTEAVLSSTLCSMPLPLYNFGTDELGRPRRRWAGTRPEAMWHPLMWLPPRVAGRYTLSDSATGSQTLEDDDLWAIRIAFEMTASGLYDPETGTWVDILSTVGLDVEDELDLARIEDWLLGESDEILDSIDLSLYLDIEPREWALESALAIRPDLKAASWALIADDLLETADDSTDPANRLGHADLLVTLRTLTGLAESFLADVPEFSDAGEATGYVNGERHAEYFERIHDLVDLASQSPEQYIVADYIAQVRERLFQIREAFWPYLEALSGLDESDA